MTEKRIQFNQVVKNQLPEYVRVNYPLISEFLTQYYLSQEFPGSSYDLLQNIDNYIKLDSVSDLPEYVILKSDISSVGPQDNIDVEVNLSLSPSGTQSFPEKYGLLLIDDEIILYESKEFGRFLNCYRGFSGIVSHKNNTQLSKTLNTTDQLVFKNSSAQSHISGSKIYNLSSLFLKEFLTKIKYQLCFGFENRKFEEGIKESTFIKQIKDFYNSKGTDESYNILFKALYGENAKVIKPKDFLFRPSDALYEITDNYIVELISGPIEKIPNLTLFQDEYNNIPKAYANITEVRQAYQNNVLNSNYYILKVDSGFNRDIRVSGATYGAFTVHTKTRVIGNYDVGSTVIDVDSTVGFENEGELLVNYQNGTTGVIAYKSKNLNQFLGCENIDNVIKDNSIISINTYAVATTADNEEIRVRINSILSGLDIPEDVKFYAKDDTAQIKHLGFYSTDPVKDAKYNDFIFNNATTWEVESFSLVDSFNKIYSIKTKSPSPFLRIGDNIRILGGYSTGVSEIISKISEKEFYIKDLELIPGINYKVKKLLSKPNILNFPESNDIIANIQNVYVDGDKFLVASSSLPSYSKRQTVLDGRNLFFSGIFSGNTFKIREIGDHGFYTGDCVYYTPEKIQISTLDIDGNFINQETVGSFLFEEGVYFVERVNSQSLRFAKSKSDIFNKKYITLESSDVVLTNNKLELIQFRNKKLESQKLLREIKPPIVGKEKKEIKPNELTGILVNGVEILSYKGTNKIIYGPIENVDVVSGGTEYDVINPPEVEILDNSGSGASGTCDMIGALKEIRIVDPGSYLANEQFQISITGGNGSGAVAEANFKEIVGTNKFSSEESNKLLNLSNSTIGFSTYHYFKNGESVVYKSFGELNIGGLTNNSIYYVNVKDAHTVSLHNNYRRSLVGVNTIQFTSYGKGIHKLDSTESKKILASISVINSGDGYKNRVREFSSSGISSSSSIFTIQSHGFETGEKIVYTTTGNPLVGLEKGREYYITKLDQNNFKLSKVSDKFSTEKLPEDFYFNSKQYVGITSTNNSVHIFKDPPINVVLSSVRKIIPENAKNVEPYSFYPEFNVQPIFRGKISSFKLKSKGFSYGSETIFDFDRQPVFNIKRGTDSQFKVIVRNGEISRVVVLKPGKNYNSPPDLLITGNGSGTGAILTPIVLNGEIIEVKVINGGVNYAETTKVSAYFPGSGANFKAKIKQWNINLVEKNFNNITEDDGYLANGLNPDYGLQYCHLYAPRKLRQILYSKDQTAKILYNSPDLKISNNVEISSSDHSPIIGWAYDGNPIYGPFGYSKNSGGSVRQMQSGYSLKLSPERPSLNYFPEGFFIEDYEYIGSNEEYVLDENNGRFCITPEFPNGTYAYFATISTDSIESTGPFRGFKKPIFPYLIGKNYHSLPNGFNFDSESNQDSIDLNKTNWKKNTYPFTKNDSDSYYEYFNSSNFNEKIDVVGVSPGKIEEIKVLFGGDGYKIDDSVIFNNKDSFGVDRGYSVSASISELVGKQISSISFATTSLYQADIFSTQNKGEYLILNEIPHRLKNLDSVVVSGFNTDVKNKISGFYPIKISSNTLSLTGIGTSTVGLSSVSKTGIVTYVSVFGNLDFINVIENDIFSIVGIGTTSVEKIKVLNVDPISSRLRILRQIDGTIGYAHSIGMELKEESRKLFIKTKLGTGNERISDSLNKINREFYFNPRETFILGNTGIGSTVYFSNPGVAFSSIFIKPGQLYIPNHGLLTGDSLSYQTNGGQSIQFRDSKTSSSNLTGISTLYVAKINDDFIGLSRSKVGLGSTGFVGIGTSTGLMYFVGFGTGVYHSFKTNYLTLKGNVTKNTVTVSLRESPGVLPGDNINVDVVPGDTNIVIKYDDYNRRMVINPRDYVFNDLNFKDNTITIKNHGYKTGQKVIHTTTFSTLHKIYYVVYVDQNRIKLSSSYYDANLKKPNLININSISTYGTISPVNPPITAYYKSRIIFDISDPSLSYVYNLKQYPAFNFSIFTDSEFKNVFESTGSTKEFNVERIGTIGSPGAKLICKLSEDVQNFLYYSLIPIIQSELGNSAIPKEKLEYYVDDEVSTNNTILLKTSEYSGNYPVAESSNNSFSYFIPKEPEANSYFSTNSILKFFTTSKTAEGPISKVKIINPGRDYYSLPTVSGITGNGKNAVLEPVSFSIGKIKGVKVVDTGLDFQTEKSLSPYFSLPRIIKVDNLYSLESVGVSSYGKGYSTAPKLVVLDGKSRKRYDDADLFYEIGNNKVTVRVNPKGLSELSPFIIPTQNSNGIKILDIQYNLNNKEVSVFLPYSFSSLEDFEESVNNLTFPFNVGDKIFIENISVGLGTTGRGFNSSDYDYHTFTITEIDKNIGGQCAIKYSLNDYILDSETPGIIDRINSSGSVVLERDFPIFTSVLKKDSFKKGETIVSNRNSKGVVEDWDSITNYIKISTKDDFFDGDTIEGLSSGTVATSRDVYGYSAYGTLSSKNKVFNGWQYNHGFLNDNLQRIQDNLYYQNFSYSIKSKVPFDTWNDSVSSLNHPVGYRKYADLEIESFIDNPKRVGLLTDSILDLSIDLVSSSDLNCFYDFDLSRENNLKISTKNSQYKISNEIYFDSRVLTDHFESRGNRVLFIDDISSQFNSGERPTPYVDLYRFDIRNFKVLKFISYIKDRKLEFSDQRQILLSTLVHNGSFGVLNQYGRVDTKIDLGSFDFVISSPFGIIRYYPTKYAINDYDVTLLSYNISDISSGIGTTSISPGTVLLEEHNIFSDGVGIGTTTPSPINILNLPKEYTSSKLLVQIDRDFLNTELDEINLVHNGVEISAIDYGQTSTNSNLSRAISGYGTYHAYTSGDYIKVDFIPENVSIGNSFKITTVNVAFGDSTSSGIGTVDLNHALLTVKSTDILSSLSPVPNTILSLKPNEDAAYCMVQILDITNNRSEFCEVCLIVDDSSSEPYISEFGNVRTHTSLGNITASLTGIGSITNLQFTPLPNTKVQVKVYANIFKLPGTENISIGINTTENTSIVNTFYDIYKGTETDKRREFNLTHNNYPIFERFFDSESTQIVDINRNMIYIPSHFFVTGEKVIYNHTDRDPLNQQIGIALTEISGIGLTDKLPSTLYIVKVNENRVRVAASASEALLLNPKTLNLTQLGTGIHKFTSTNQNSRVIISLDNIIQSPIVSTAKTTSLSSDVILSDEIITLGNTDSLIGADLIKINDEIMRVQSVRSGNKVSVRRSWMGTKLQNHGAGSLVTKVLGSVNIVNNTLSFAEAPYGNEPAMFDVNPWDEQDWLGIQTGSSFDGRCFLRSGIPNGIYDTYYKNYIIDDISEQFDGKTSTFTLKSSGNDISGISEEGALILINDIPQSRGFNVGINSEFNFSLSENSGITSITFLDLSSPAPTDLSYSNLPKGGIIVSVGSTEGLGYQPLVSSGATCVVSISGTIQSISIGNSGSGYRSKESYELITNVSSTIGVGSTSIFIDNKNSVFGLLNLLNTGSNCKVSIGTYIKSSSITSVGSSFINIGIGSTSQYQILKRTPVNIRISNPPVGFVNIESDNVLDENGNSIHIGFATIINGSVSNIVSITTSVYVGVTTIPPKIFIEKPQSYYNIPLIYSSDSPAGIGTGATIDIIVGQGSSVIDYELNNSGYGYNAGEILTVPTGGLVGIPTNSDFGDKEFKIFIDNVFDDKLTGWAFGELQILDDISDLFDGERKSFQLRYLGEIFEIRGRRGSNINPQDLLLVFMNGVLQVPRQSYIFRGGSRILFTEAPKGPSSDEAGTADICKILFYKGTSGVDVVYKNILETVKSGDTLSLGYNPDNKQFFGLQEDKRFVSRVESTDIVSTNPYPGPGISQDELLSRPIVWCKQTEDKIIGTSIISKERMLYEPNIHPLAHLIKSVGVGETILYVDNVRPFFNQINEINHPNGSSDYYINERLSFQRKVNILNQDDISPAFATAVVSSSGTISSLILSSGGNGYIQNPDVSIGGTGGALVEASISNNSVVSLTISNPGSGYTSSNPPKVLIEQPKITSESNNVSKYYGDSGVIVGFGTTSQFGFDKLIFDFFIPLDSQLRDANIVGTSSTITGIAKTSISGISTGDYFIVTNSIVGVASTSYRSLDSTFNVVGIVTSFVDGIYEVDSYLDTLSNVIGVGNTIIRRVFAKISGFGTVNFSSTLIDSDSTQYTYDNVDTIGSGYTGYIHKVSPGFSSSPFGNYSWGKIILSERSENNVFSVYNKNGVVGINSSPVIIRTNYLKFIKNTYLGI